MSAEGFVLDNYIALDPHGTPCLQAVASNSVSLVPTISVNGLIRWRDDFRQRMDDLRIYRRLKREEDLLQKYGAALHTHTQVGCCQHNQQPPADDIT